MITSFGCSSKQEEPSLQNAQQSTAFKLIDSLYISNNYNDANALLDSLKNIFPHNDTEAMTNYYYYKARLKGDDLVHVNKYADSALMLFKNPVDEQQFSNAYIKAMLLKTDVFVYFKQYENALAYYFKITPLLNKKKQPAVYLDYLGKISYLYYQQSKFKEAAQYYLSGLEVIEDAKNLTQPTYFFLKQGILNNAAFSYENALMLDSAENLYLKGLSFIDSVAKTATIAPQNIEASRLVFLDNLGGLMLKTARPQLAEELLEQAIAIGADESRSSKHTAYLKLAATYIKLGKLKAADSVLSVGKKIIDRDKNSKDQLNLRFFKVKADLLFAQKNFVEAYRYANLRSALVDSLNLDTKQLSSMDLKLRFQNLQDKQDLQNLEKTNDNKTTYLVGLGLFLLMLAPIILLVLKNTRQAKRAEKITIKQNKALEKTMKRLELRNKDYAKMMKVMAHDLKNPIGGMVGIANLLLESNHFTKEDQELLQLIESSGENAIEMINQLLNSGLAVENEELKKEKVDVQHLVRQCTELLQYKANEKNQKIIFISGGPVIVSLSKEKMWRVFNNLIVNAIKFSPESTEIKVILEHLAKSVKISIIDQGIGVPQKDKEKIFEMFTTAKRPGTAGEQPFGIGLSISKQIIESHDGKIWLDENPLGGTIFYIELPIT